MDYWENTENERNIFKGKIINVKELDVKLPNGKIAKREIVEHPGAVAILAFTNDKKIVLVRQFRKAVEEILWEIPAGKLENGEEPLSCATRELQEETGYSSKNLQEIAVFYSTPGFSNEVMYLFTAHNLQQGETCFDDDEYLEIFTFDRDEINELLRKGQIKDAKTLVGLMWAFKEDYF